MRNTFLFYSFLDTVLIFTLQTSVNVMVTTILRFSKIDVFQEALALSTFTGDDSIKLKNKNIHSPSCLIDFSIVSTRKREQNREREMEKSYMYWRSQATDFFLNLGSSNVYFSLIRLTTIQTKHYGNEIDL